MNIVLIFDRQTPSSNSAYLSGNPLHSIIFMTD